MDNLYTPHLPPELVDQLDQHPITGVHEEIAVLRVVLANALAHLPANPTFNQRLRLLHAAARAASVIARLSVTAGDTFDAQAEWSRLADLALQAQAQALTEPEPEDYVPYLGLGETVPSYWSSEDEDTDEDETSANPDPSSPQPENSSPSDSTVSSPSDLSSASSSSPSVILSSSPSSLCEPPRPLRLCGSSSPCVCSSSSPSPVHSFHSFFSNAPP